MGIVVQTLQKVCTILRFAIRSDNSAWDELRDSGWGVPSHTWPVGMRNASDVAGSETIAGGQRSEIK